MFIHKINDELGLKFPNILDAKMIYDCIEKNREHIIEWMTWLEGIDSYEDYRAYLQNGLHLYAENQRLSLIILHKGKMAGMIRFCLIDNINNFAEIGYWLDKDCVGKGIVTKACKALLDIGFNEYNFNRIFLRVAKGNKKSKNVPKRLGMVHEGPNRENRVIHGKYLDMHVYSMLKSEYIEAENSKR